MSALLDSRPGPLLDPQSEWARLLLAAFAEAGVRELVLSPGSRSTPFALAAASDSRLRIHSIIDERAAGFFALGQAKAGGRPSLLLCTSGSAPAHYLPAIVEARQSRTPLLVLTADRPLESQHAGAHQTIDQGALFGRFVEASYELGGVDATAAALRGTRRLVAQAVALATGAPGGAVHLNARARKPLEPYLPTDADERASSERIRAAARLPLVAVTGCERVATGLQHLARRIAETAEGLIVVGPAPASDRRLAPALIALAEASGYPVAIEPTSQLLGAGHPAVLPALLPALYASAEGRAALRPRLVLQIGGPPVASGYEKLLAESPAPELHILARTAEVDAESRAVAVHEGDPLPSIEALTRALAALRLERASSPWLARAILASTRARHAISQLIASAAADDEVAAVAALLRAVNKRPTPPTLFVGNSLPVRELALAAAVEDHAPLTVVHQRGASGIDGLCAGAAGLASISGPTLLLLGDVSLLHDLHGLYLAQRAQRPLVLVVLCNGGGRIFDQLPIGLRADLAGTIELFTTPAEPELACLARFAGVRHARVDTRSAIATEVDAALSHAGATLLELRLSPGSAAAFAAALPLAVAEALA